MQSCRGPQHERSRAVAAVVEGLARARGAARYAGARTFAADARDAPHAVGGLRHAARTADDRPQARGLVLRLRSRRALPEARLGRRPRIRISARLRADTDKRPYPKNAVKKVTLRDETLSGIPARTFVPKDARDRGVVLFFHGGSTSRLGAHDARRAHGGDRHREPHEGGGPRLSPRPRAPLPGAARGRARRRGCARFFRDAARDDGARWRLRGRQPRARDGDCPSAIAAVRSHARWCSSRRGAISRCPAPRTRRTSATTSARARSSCATRAPSRVTCRSAIGACPDPRGARRPAACARGGRRVGEIPRDDIVQLADALEAAGTRITRCTSPRTCRTTRRSSARSTRAGRPRSRPSQRSSPSGARRRRSRTRSVVPKPQRLRSSRACARFMRPSSVCLGRHTLCTTRVVIMPLTKKELVTIIAPVAAGRPRRRPRQNRRGLSVVAARGRGEHGERPNLWHSE